MEVPGEIMMQWKSRSLQRASSGQLNVDCVALSDDPFFEKNLLRPVLTSAV